jgi:hypothetical protein
MHKLKKEAIRIHSEDVYYNAIKPPASHVATRRYNARQKLDN